MNIPGRDYARSYQVSFLAQSPQRDPTRGYHTSSHESVVHGSGRSSGSSERHGNVTRQKLTARRSSRVFNSGESPPCMQRNCLFMMAARGSAQKDSMQASYTRSVYLCLPSNMSGNNSFVWQRSIIHSSLNVK